VSTESGSSNNIWHSLLFNFIVSAAPELILGTVDPTSLMPTGSPNNYNIFQSISSHLLSGAAQTIPVIFLSGVDLIESSELPVRSLE
jgi:hypothetical protein